MTEPRQTPQRHWTAGAVALLVIGLVILVPSGLCTAYLGIMGILYGGNSSETSDLLTMALLYGGPFVFLGALFVYLGFRIRKQN
jgi:uncharacterized membrane protein HdeD (DUF308 family)